MNNEMINVLAISEEMKQLLDVDLAPVELDTRILADISAC